MALHVVVQILKLSFAQIVALDRVATVSIVYIDLIGAAAVAAVGHAVVVVHAQVVVAAAAASARVHAFLRARAAVRAVFVIGAGAGCLLGLGLGDWAGGLAYVGWVVFGVVAGGGGGGGGVVVDVDRAAAFVSFFVFFEALA